MEASESYRLAADEPVVHADMKRHRAAARADDEVYDTGVPPFFRAFLKPLRQQRQD